MVSRSLRLLDSHFKNRLFASVFTTTIVYLFNECLSSFIFLSCCVPMLPCIIGGLVAGIRLLAVFGDALARPVIEVGYVVYVEFVLVLFAV